MNTHKPPVHCIGFVYLACTTILPEILETDATLYMRILQIFFVGLGLAFMYAVGVLEEMEEQQAGGMHHVQTQNNSEL